MTTPSNVQWNNQQPETLGWTKGSFVPFNYHGVTFPGGCNSRPSVAVILTHALDALIPHVPGGLVAGQCWGADWSDQDSDSFHLYGLALDVNAPENPQTSIRHSYGSQYELPSNAGAILAPFGIQWGGDWTPDTPPDYMHCQLMLTPTQADALATSLVHVTPVPPSSSWHPWVTVGAGRRTVQQWDCGTDVRQLQTVLNAWYPHMTALATDGYYGPLTTSRVKYNQSAAGIAVDGICGPITWKELGFLVSY